MFADQYPPVAQLHFCPDSAIVDIDPDAAARTLNDSASAVLDDVVHTSSDRLREYGVIRIRIGSLRLGRPESYKLKSVFVEKLLTELRFRLGLPELRLQKKVRALEKLPKDVQARSLLPHLDGRATYLTASRGAAEVGQDRAPRSPFQSITGTTSDPHVLYHGIFVDDPGTALSLNPYYPLIDIVSDGYCFVRGKVPVHIQEVADWVDDNVRMFWENRPSLQLSGASRVTIGAYLGFGEGLFAATGDLWVESDFSPQQYEAIPELASLSRYCNCGACLSPVERLNCLMLEHCLGLTRQAFCRRYQTCVPTERFDLIIANNLALLHGSIAAGRDRRIEILHFMCDQPIPESYEVWLADLWAAPPRLRHITPE